MSMASCMTSFMTSSTRGWSGILISPWMFSKQAATSGKTAARRSSLRMRWICGGNFLAVLKAEQGERAVGVPAEAGGEDGRAGEDGLLKDVFDGFGLEEVEDIGEREAVLLGEGDVDAVVGGGGLQLEVEAAAEALAQGQVPRRG